MEGSDIPKASTSSIRLGSLRASSGPARSIRAASTSLWRNSGMDVFSKSSREENDEEALKWAALEKLPTFDRLKKGLLFGSTGPSNEVDIDSLGDQDRKRLVDRLVNAADEDNEKFLLRLRNRIDRVGIDLPTIEVKFEHLTVEADVNTGSRALPSFLNFYLDFWEGILNIFHLLPNKKKHITILDDVSGIIKPGKMTLLLGPPSSGKTTLLLALADGLAKELQKSGKVTYNGHELHEFVPKRTSAYISQNDVHIGEMTVRETLAFSARCQGVGSRYEMLAELSRREKNANIKPDPDIDVYMKAAASEGQEASVVTDYTLKILGLDVCADTLVGDRMIRGISGGQRKRVTTGEMIVGPSKVLFMDEISTGLDSSTTFQIVNSLKQYVHILEGTVIISLLQPAPETYNLFDEILLLSDGKIVYEGPRENVLEFFESMGFKCPDRKGAADFLQEVTSKKDQKQYWMRTDEPYRFVTSKEFAKAYESFHVGRKIASEVATPYDKSKSHPAALTNNNYGLGKRELLKACMDREILLMKRNSFVYFFKLFQLTVMGIVAMTVFFRTKMHRRGIEEGGLYVGALFFGVTMIMFNGMAEISMTIAKLPVFYKQRDFLFFPTWVYALPSWFVKIPVSFVEAALWTGLTYHVMGFDPNIWRFLKHFFILVAVNQMSSALFRFIGAAGRNMIIANTFGSFALLILFALGGFVLLREDVKKWWIWGYWISPMMYAMNGIVVNEYLGHKFKKPFGDSTLGRVIVKSRGLFAETYWYWIAIAALLGFMLLYNLCYALSLQFLDRQATVEDDDESSSTTNEGNENTKRGMVLPFEPHSITFDDIKYSVDMPQEMKDQGVTEDRLVLLKNLSGAFRPGVLTALMGDIEGVSKITNGYNPATWMLEVSTASQEVALGVDFTEIYKNSELYARNKTLIAELSQPRPGSTDLHFATQYSTSFFIQCWVCLWKQRQSYWRNPPYTAVRFTFTTFIAIMFGTIFWDLGGKREEVQDLSNAMGSLYTSVLFIGVQNASAVQPVVDIERTVFYRERAAGMYSALPYAFAQVLVEIPYILTQAAAYGVIVYAMIGFDWTAAKFFWFLYFMFCSLLYMTFYGT